jgi:hypothetical protein
VWAEGRKELWVVAKERAGDVRFLSRGWGEKENSKGQLVDGSKEKWMELVLDKRGHSLGAAHMVAVNSLIEWNTRTNKHIGKAYTNHVSKVSPLI